MNARASRLTAILTLGLFVPQALAITGGEVDVDNTYSNVGALVYLGPYGPSPGNPIPLLSGTLIHPRVFLTAGHGTDFLLQEHPEAIPGCHISFGNDARDPDTWHEIGAIITHPNYSPIRNQSCNDVGVVILKEPIYDLPLARLPCQGLLDHLKAAHLLRKPSHSAAPFTVVGYGSTLDWPPPEITDGDGWRRFAHSDYLALTPGWLFTQQNPATGNGGTGYGDSGGPAFWVEADGTLILVALTGHGDPNLVATNIAWRVDLPETLAFIDWVISMVDAGLLP